MYDNQSSNKPIKRPRGRPRGMRRVTHCTHGAYSKNPMEVYEYWKKHAPGIADFVDGLFNGFKRKLGWGEGHPQTEELQRLCVMMASRNIMTNNAIEKGGEEVGLALEVVDIVEGVMKDQLPKSILHIGTYSSIYDSYHNDLFRPKGKG